MGLGAGGWGWGWGWAMDGWMDGFLRAPDTTATQRHIGRDGLEKSLKKEEGEKERNEGVRPFSVRRALLSLRVGVRR